jgi:hypothetical protein
MSILHYMFIPLLVFGPVPAYAQATINDIYKQQQEVIKEINELQLLVKVQLENHELRLRFLEKKADERETRVDTLELAIERKQSVDVTSERIYGGIYTLAIAIVVVVLTFLGQYILQSKRNKTTPMDRVDWNKMRNGEVKKK